jgi:hypothetical protein
MMCESIGCPHPRFLESLGVTQSDLADWRVYYLFRNGVLDTKEDSSMSEEEQISFLKKLQEAGRGKATN